MAIESFKKEMSFSKAYHEDLYAGLCPEIDAGNPQDRNLLEALRYIEYGLVANPGIIFDLFNPENAKCGVSDNVIFYDSYIDDSQGLAVKKALKMDNILLIQGPPGAGKSTTIVEMIRQLKKADPKARFLVTCQSHVAVDSVLEKLVNKGFTNIIRVAAKNETNEILRPYYFETIYKEFLNSMDPNKRTIVEKFDVVLQNLDKTKTINELMSNNMNKIIVSKDVVGITSNSIKNTRLPLGDAIDYTIVDEVGKMTFAELMFVVRFSKKIILIGDPNQLPAVLKQPDVNSNYNKEAYNHLRDNPFINTLFATINPYCKVFLNKQYRMAKQIGNYISDCFYDYGEDKLQNGVSTIDNPNALNFVDYEAKGRERGVVTEDGTTDLSNPFEGDIVEKIIQKCNADGVDVAKDIAIITPYAMQKSYLLNRFKFIRKENIDTVDAFQGREAKIVIFSCGRNVHVTEFFKKPNRINVAISRAISEIWIVGNEQFCLNVSYFRKFIEYNKVDNESCLSRCNKYYYDGLGIRKSQP